jgi:hypothetical protein
MMRLLGAALKQAIKRPLKLFWKWLLNALDFKHRARDWP